MTIGKGKVETIFGYNYWLPVYFAVIVIGVCGFGYFVGDRELLGVFPYIAVCFVAVAFAFMLRVVVSDQEIRIRYLISLGRNRTIYWDQIAAVRLHNIRHNAMDHQDVHIELTSGEIIRFSPWGVRGCEDLCELVANIGRLYDKTTAAT